MKNEPTLKFARQLGDAIGRKSLVRILYDGETRIVAPYIYGRSPTGKMILSGYQIRNLSTPSIAPDWRTFYEDKIDEFELLDQPFQPRWDYNPRDKNFKLTVWRIER